MRQKWGNCGAGKIREDPGKFDGLIGAVKSRGLPSHQTLVVSTGHCTTGDSEGIAGWLEVVMWAW
jgi:hypothetical protein